MRARVAVLIVGSLILAATAFATGPDFPKLTGRVVDEAEILNAAQEADLATRLESHENETTNQIVVATLSSLRGYTIADFGFQLGRHWGIGQKDKNNGVLLIVAPSERKVRIEVGYGLEGDVTDAISKTIIEREILPKFRQNDFSAGIDAGVTAILAVLKGEYKSPAKHRTPVIFVTAMVLAIGMWLHNLISGAIGGVGSGGRRGRGSSSGGFRGGGGSFGGGGASGSW